MRWPSPSGASGVCVTRPQVPGAADVLAECGAVSRGMARALAAAGAFRLASGLPSQPRRRRLRPRGKFTCNRSWDIQVQGLPAPVGCPRELGGAPSNPDYALWYGWSEMVQALTEIRQMAKELREARE